MDFLFPLALLFVFSVTCLLTLLLSANAYEKQTSQSERAFRRDTALSYLTEKIHQSDSNGCSGIRICEFDDLEALAISETYGEKPCTTYIYSLNGKLMELFLLDGTEASPEAGTAILDIDSIHMEQVSDHVFRFTCTDSVDGSESVYVTLRSEAFK